jgi:hypothetical protein
VPNNLYKYVAYVLRMKSVFDDEVVNTHISSLPYYFLCMHDEGIMNNHLTSKLWV